MHRTDYLIAQRCRGRVLDLGCTSGRRSLLIDMMGHDVLGIDEDSPQIARAQDQARACGLEHCRFESVGEAWAADRGFDTIVVSSSSLVMERVLLTQVDRILEPDGQIILAVPDSTHVAGHGVLSISGLQALRAKLSHIFPVIEDIQDDLTDWQMSIFRWGTAAVEEVRASAPAEHVDAAPKVSVVMTTYNREGMIRRAIDSVLTQTHPHVELIVVNDGSTDGTQEVLDSYGSRIVALRKARNEGIAAATNTGLEAASGTFVQRFDDDDVMFPRKIACQVKRFAAQPALGLVYTAAYVQNALPDKKTFACMGRFIPLSEYALWPSIELLNSATLVRKQCLDEIGVFDCQLTGMAECDRFTRIMARHAYEYLPVPGVLYMKHGENHTIKQQQSIRESAKRIHQTLMEDVDIDHVFGNIAQIEDADERRKHYSLAFLRRGKVGLAKGCPELACRDFERALALAPENEAAKRQLAKAREAMAKSSPDQEAKG